MVPIRKNLVSPPRQPTNNNGNRKKYSFHYSVTLTQITFLEKRCNLSFVNRLTNYRRWQLNLKGAMAGNVLLNFHLVIAICQLMWLYTNLSTSSLIWPSYTIRSTIFEKVFWTEKFPKTKYFPTKRILSLSNRTCKFSSRTYLLPLLPISYVGRASRPLNPRQEQ